MYSKNITKLNKSCNIIIIIYKIILDKYYLSYIFVCS
jgi:hypothetical protein